MRILLILECTKSAYKRSRKIAAKYLNQIGRRTFENNLSDKALSAMYNELKEITSKNNSIVCYKTTLNEKKIMFKLGSQKKFNEDGYFMYKTKNIEPEFSFNFEQSYILKLTEISALFHDIGKANKGFQLTLDYGVKESIGVANKYRHELISFYMLMELIEKIKISNSIENEKDLISILIECFKTPSTDNYLINSSVPDNGAEFFTKQSNWDKFPIINSILWLVLSHHKLAKNDYGNENVFEFSEYKKDDYSTQNNEYLKKFEDFVKSKCHNNFENIFTDFDTSSLQFLEDSDFNKKLVENFEYLLNNYDYFYKLNQIEKSFTESKMPSMLTLIARPALVFSDYKASADKAYIGPRIPGVAYANTMKQDEVTVMCDTLLTHLNKTYRNVSASLRLFLDTNNISDFRRLRRDFIGKVEESVQKDKIPEKFLWQEKAKMELLQYQNEDVPFFGILMAGTGCGKTRASLKFLTALNNKKLRITVGLGLRTLSCQTHKEYTKEIFNGLQHVENEIGLAVGTCLNNLEKIEDLGEDQNYISISKSTNDLDEVPNYNGSTAESSSVDDDLDFYLDDNIDLNNKTLQVIAKTNKDKIIIDKPVVVMTIDNIMKAFKQDISSNLRYLMRIVSSDFVLDEIDDYDTKDLISISCLIYMLGYFRRKVFISSATVTPEISKTLFDFYQSGVMDNLNNDKTIVYGFINESNVQTYKKDFSKIQGSVFVNDLNNFTLNVYNTITAKNLSFTKHRIGVVGLDTINGLTMDKANQALYNSIKSLHHFNEIHYEDLNISTGFIKFNNVSESQDFSTYLGETSRSDNDYHVVWVNYHSHFMNLERFFIEDFLDTNMVRKSVKEPILHSYHGSVNLFKSEYFLKQIKNAKELNKKNLIFVLSTTNIIEVGRDHDYDWAIIEPASIKSVVQSLGRVKRHRDINVHQSVNDLPKDYVNVLLFDKFIVDIKNNNKNVNYLSKVMAYPGIQTDRTAKLKDMPIFPLETVFSTGGNLSTVYASLDTINKYSSHKYKQEKVLKHSIFSQQGYFSQLFDQSFLQNPSNKFLVHDQHQSQSLIQSYSNFRLLTMEKFKQEFYLNSDYHSDVISARYYLNNFNKEIISKMSKEFYTNNEFRNSAMSKQIYLASSVKNLFENHTMLYNDFGNTYKTKFLMASYKNKKRVFVKTPDIAINKNFCANYFFSDIYFNEMYEKISNNHNLNKESVKVKFTMLELTLKYVDRDKPMNFEYNLGLGKVENKKNKY